MEEKNWKLKTYDITFKRTFTIQAATDGEALVEALATIASDVCEDLFFDPESYFSYEVKEEKNGK